MLAYGSLFSGIEGFGLGFDRAGMRCAWQVEIDEFSRGVLAKHWPEIERHGDVRGCGEYNLQRVDVLCGGFPCQPHSVAGRRMGSGDERWLWPEFNRIICEIKPRWVVVENVRGLLSVNSGREFGIILRDLADNGYDAEWDVLRASDVGAPHRRDRVFLVAHTNSQWESQPQGSISNKWGWDRHGIEAHITSHNLGKRIQRFFSKEIPWFDSFSWCKDVRRIEDLRGRSDIPEPLIRRTRDGIPDYMDRIRCIGNAVVPQLAEWIGRRIIELDALWEE